MAQETGMKPIPALAALARAAGLEGVPVGPGDLAPLGGQGGAYLLAMALGKGTTIAFRGGPLMLAPGLYLYAGSARGPGGIRARLARHFRRDKKPHWHVDALTVLADAMAALAIPGGSECAIVAALAAAPDGADGRAVTFPQDGFGSSDCPACRAHLMRWNGAAPARLPA